jgi:hypothetical protein
MRSSRIFAAGCAAALLVALNAVNAAAQGPIDSRTEFTFNSPIEMPGATLPPGTYVFRFADPNASRQVMQVMDKSSNKTYGLFLTISAVRPKASDDAELRFLETPAGKPAAVKTWWYPGNTIGREFIYPKDQARKLAMATQTTVLTTRAAAVNSSQMQTAELSYVSPTGQETPVSDNNSSGNGSVTAASARSSSGNLDKAPVRESQSAANMSTRQRLPRTGTDLPLWALMGVTSLAGGVTRLFRR